MWPARTTAIIIITTQTAKVRPDFINMIKSNLYKCTHEFDFLIDVQAKQADAADEHNFQSLIQKDFVGLFCIWS